MIVVGVDLRTNRIITTTHDHHGIVLGPPRSGKTSAFLAPSVMMHPGPAVVTSSKEDIIALTAHRRAQDGPIQVLDLGQRMDNLPPGAALVTWDPLDGCLDTDTATQRASSMVGAVTGPYGTGDKNRFWNSQAAHLLASLLQTAAAAGQSICDVADWAVFDQLEEPRRIAEALGLAGAAGHLNAHLGKDPAMRDGVTTTTADCLLAYTSEAVRRSLDRAGFSMQDLLENNGTLYIVSPSHVQAMLAPVIVGLIEDIKRHAYQRSRSWHADPATNPGSVLMALDEAYSIAPLPDLDKILTDGGSQGVQLYVGLQDMAQAEQRWRTIASGFPTLFRHKVLLPGIMHAATLEPLSLLLGEDVVPTQGAYTTMRRFPAHTIAAGQPGQALHINGADPDWVGTRSLFDYPH